MKGANGHVGPVGTGGTGQLDGTDCTGPRELSSPNAQMRDNDHITTRQRRRTTSTLLSIPAGDDEGGQRRKCPDAGVRDAASVMDARGGLLTFKRASATMLCEIS